MESKVEPVQFKCGKCLKIFKYNRALSSHIEKYHPRINSKNLNRRLQITQPDSDSLVEDEKKIEKSLSNKNYSAACNLCSKVYSSNQALSEHVRIKHNSDEKSIPNENDEWKCAICIRTHPNRLKLIEHVVEDHRVVYSEADHLEKCSKCDHCEKSFQRSVTLTKHVRQNHPQVYVPSKTRGAHFICNTCDCHFGYRKTLIRHIQDKHPEEMCSELSNQAYCCPFCPVKFEYYVNLKQHVKRIHPDKIGTLKEKCNKYFICDSCSISFVHRYDLTRHKLKEHPTGIAKELADAKRFPCNFCSKRFYHKFNMRLHCRKKHPKDWNLFQKRKEGCISCAHCNKWYSSRMSLISHLRKKHPSTIAPSCCEPKEERLSVVDPAESNQRTRGHRYCPLCSATFMRKEDIYEHFRASHDKKIEIRAIDVADERAFYDWKREFENETKSKFVKYNNYKSKKEIVKIFVCHRSGCFQSRSRGFRQLRLAGSEKINGYCPAFVRFTHNLVTNQCIVHVIDEHVGHGQELQFLKLEEPSKMLRLDSQLDLSVVDEHLRTLPTRFAPAAAIPMPKQENLDEKHLFDTIVLSAWISENDDSVVYVKGPEEFDSDFPHLNTGVDGDFVFIIMNDFQATMFAQYASDIVAVNRMEGPDDYDLELFVVMVVDNYRQGIPCCLMLSNRSDQYAYEVLFTKLAERAGRVKPQVFMSDTREAYINAWKSVMPAPERQLLCSWYVLRCWEKNLSRIACPRRRKQMRQFLYEMRMELNPFRFHERLQQMLSMDDDDELAPFIEYFRQNFVKIESTWAYCYRKHAGINTNYVCDRFFRSFRRVYLRGRSTFSLEEMLDAIALLLKSLPQEKLIREVKGKLVSKIKLARLRHAIVARWSEEQLEAINCVTENKWYVPSDDEVAQEEICQVERVLDRCDCKLVCRECRACLHQYRCSCLDNCIQYNMCTHIHAVCMLQNRLRAVGDDNDLIEELEVDVLGSVVMDADHVVGKADMKDEEEYFLKMEEG